MTEGETKKIFTIGSSNRSLQEFIDLLKAYEITVLVDVRIFPYSKRFPNFIKESLEESIPAIAMELFRRGWEVIHVIEKDRTWQPKSR